MDNNQRRGLTRRDALRAGVAVGVGAGLAGCSGAGDGPAFADGFEEGFDWESAAHIGPEEDVSDFEWYIERSRGKAFEGDWSIELFTEGDYDDGTAWAVTEFSPPAGAEEFEVSFSAWSESESFNILRNVVARLGGERPTEEGDFPDPGMNTTAVKGAPYGGLREPLHLAEGWHEYTFSWEPDAVPETLYLALGVSVVWETDATHYIDNVTVEAV